MEQGFVEHERDGRSIGVYYVERAVNRLSRIASLFSRTGLSFRRPANGRHVQRCPRCGHGARLLTSVGSSVRSYRCKRCDKCWSREDIL